MLFSEDIRELDEATLLAVTAEVPSSELARAELEGDGVELVELVVRSGLEPSRGAARRTISQGGISVNNRRIDDPESRVTTPALLHDRYLLLRKGKSRRLVLVA